jgi:hypothetical protein
MIDIFVVVNSYYYLCDYTKHCPLRGGTSTRSRSRPIYELRCPPVVEQNFTLRPHWDQLLHSSFV